MFKSKKKSPQPAASTIAGGAYGESAGNAQMRRKPLLTSRATKQALLTYRLLKANPELNRQRAREGMQKLRAANGRT